MKLYEIHAVNLAMLVMLAFALLIITKDLGNYLRSRMEARRQRAIYEYHSAKCRQALIHLGQAVGSDEEFAKADQEVEQAMKEYRIKVLGIE